MVNMTLVIKLGLQVCALNLIANGTLPLKSN
jgi:hypothetical protein